MTPQDLKQIADLMDEKLTPINTRLDTIDARLDTIDTRLDAMDEKIGTMDAKIDAIAETQAEHTVALNVIIEWCEEAGKLVGLPFFEVK